MKKQQYIKSLEDAFDVYGRDNLIPISFLRQQIFYARHGCQPRFIWEKEDGSGKIVAWYLKCETNYVSKLWKDNRPQKD